MQHFGSALCLWPANAASASGWLWLSYWRQIFSSWLNGQSVKLKLNGNVFKHERRNLENVRVSGFMKWP